MSPRSINGDAELRRDGCYICLLPLIPKAEKCNAEARTSIEYMLAESFSGEIKKIGEQHTELKKRTSSV
jgi:hypothetical protein